MSEAAYLRMLIKGTVPQTKPADEYYEMLQQMRLFNENLEKTIFAIEAYDRSLSTELQRELKRWNKFQLDVQRHFQLPEKRDDIWR